MTTLGQMKLKQQIAHIKEHEDTLLQVVPFRNVEEYFRAYSGSHPDLYERVCKHLKIEPRVK